MKSPHANYVVQEIIRKIPLEQIDFIVQEVEQMGLVLHQYGCRIVCRLLENYDSMQPSDSMKRILERLVQWSGDLILKLGGHRVVESLLEHGQASHKAKILTELKAMPIEVVAHHDRGAFVVAKALQHGCAEDVDKLSEQILAQGPERLARMASGWSGQHVARALIETPWGRQSLSDSCECRAAQAILETSKTGRDMLQELKGSP